MTQPVAEHLVASTRNRDRSLLQPHRAAWLWSHLRDRIPDALSCVLMPDHLQLVAPPGYLDGFRRVLTGFTVRFSVRFEVLPPVLLRSPAITARVIRYGYLNPLRAGLADDPWTWWWSSLRDIGGACHPRWSEAGQLAARLDLPTCELTRRLTWTADSKPPGLVGDPVHVSTFHALEVAVAVSARVPLESVRARTQHRRLVVQLAYAAGRVDAHQLAAHLGCSPRTIHRHRKSPAPGLAAAITCLREPRLLRPLATVSIRAKTGTHGA